MDAEDQDSKREDIIDGSAEPADEIQAEPQDEAEAPEDATAQDTAAEPDAGFCTQCGVPMRGGDRYCRNCRWDSQGEPAEQPPPSPRNLGPASDFNRLTVLLLCLFLGWLGVHRFYVGRSGSGLLWLFTFGFLGVGMIYDLVLIATGEFTDDQGRRLLHWQ
jgi:hypothetical protein